MDVVRICFFRNSEGIQVGHMSLGGANPPTEVTTAPKLKKKIDLQMDDVSCFTGKGKCNANI